jgi:hypothetical protein
VKSGWNEDVKNDDPDCSSDKWGKQRSSVNSFCREGNARYTIDRIGKVSACDKVSAKRDFAELLRWGSKPWSVMLELAEESTLTASQHCGMC